VTPYLAAVESILAMKLCIHVPVVLEARHISTRELNQIAGPRIQCLVADLDEEGSLLLSSTGGFITVVANRPLRSGVVP
jgi:hypothetical protein